MTHAMAYENLYCDFWVFLCIIGQIHNGTCDAVCDLVRMHWIYFFNHVYLFLSLVWGYQNGSWASSPSSMAKSLC